MRTFAAYAGPSTWGPWLDVAHPVGSVAYAITAEPVGDTTLRCRVRYYKDENNQVVEEWRESVNIVTGNAVATVDVSFMGLLTGTAVNGTINP
ncbi:MAG: hypothetical protein JOZ29_13565 [Deltaproteobacteria bacterium]|nr:hypothetical protein [Deltaproteobacteria bacterium]